MILMSCLEYLTIFITAIQKQIFQTIILLQKKMV